MGMSFITLMLMLRLSLTTADLLADVKCEEDPLGYVVPDPTYCDRYLECGPGRGSSIQLCPPGQALDLQTGFCQVEGKVDCSTREMRYQRERAKLTSPVRRFHSRGGSGLLSRGGSSQVTERNLSRGGPSQVTERNPLTTTAPLPVTEATLEEDESVPRINLFGARRRPSILSSKSTATILPETVSTTPKVSSRPRPFTRNLGGEDSNKLPHRHSSFTSRTNAEDVASTAEHSNDAVTTNPPRRGLFVRINNPTRKPLLRNTDGEESSEPHRQSSFTSRTIAEDVASDAEHFNDATNTSPSRSIPFGRITNPTRKPLLRTLTKTPRRTSSNVHLKPVAEGTSLEDVGCDGSEEYIVPDPTYCDRYLSCPGKKTILCLSGMVLDINLGFCQRKAVTDCGGRKLSFREVQEEEEQTRRIEEEMSEIIAASTGATQEFTRSSHTTTSPARRGPYIRITNPTRKPLLKTKETPTPLQAIISQVFEDETSSKTVSTDPLLDVECEAGSEEYVVPDPAHCDRYLSCPEGQVEICQRGLVIDLDTGYCVRRRLTDCKGRERLFRDVENEVEAKLDEKVRKLEEDSRLKSKLSKTINGPHEESKPIRTTISPASPSKAVSSHSPDLVPSFEVDAEDTASRSSFSRFAFPSRSVPDSPSTLQDGILARKPVSASSESLFSRISVSKPSSSDDTNPGRPLLKSSPLHSTVSRIQSSEPGVSDSNQGRPIVLRPASSTTTTTTTTTPPVEVDPLSELTCELSEAGYIVPDPQQCDRFAECSFQGEKFYKLCPIGLVLSMTKGVCDYPEQVDCSDRPKLQSSLGRGQCPRLNGQFVVETDTSCRQYVDCKSGKGFVKSCGVGQVFDENLGCVHPDQSTRHGCDPDEFQCPTSGLRQKFGDHDRLSHPTDCKLFYSCQKNGQKRLLGCQKPSVFNPDTGLCDAQENVPGCEGYYVQEVVGVDQGERDKIAQEIREQLIKEFGLDRRFS